MAKSINQPVVVIPNLNGGDEVLEAIASLIKQTLQPYIIVVDNASTDGSPEAIAKHYPDIELIFNSSNLGYTGGVNPGFERAIELEATYVVPFNDDATADTHWLQHLVAYLDTHPEVAAAACKVVTMDGKCLDSTGDYYTNWGLPYPRGRRESDLKKYDSQTEIFAASGAASAYRVAGLKEVGLLDQDFFAYYEDVDLSFRMQLAGWKVAYVPDAVVYHRIGMTSQRVKGFTTYQTMKNQPLLLWKNVPRRYLWTVGWRFFLAHTMFFGRAVTRGQGWAALKGDAKGTQLLIAGFKKRRHIQRTKKVSDEYIWNMMVHDLPPNAHALRSLRNMWWKISRKKTI